MSVKEISHPQAVAAMQEKTTLISELDGIIQGATFEKMEGLDIQGIISKETDAKAKTQSFQIQPTVNGTPNCMRCIVSVIRSGKKAGGLTGLITHVVSAILLALATLCGVAPACMAVSENSRQNAQEKAQESANALTQETQPQLQQLDMAIHERTARIAQLKNATVFEFYSVQAGVDNSFEKAEQAYNNCAARNAAIAEKRAEAARLVQAAQAALLF